ncbi:hypothetical protein J2W56_000682 [Nocardia kruczakiae]|uniref:Uncharacterized protein n=1 Tax=Nocardia kruczakiae TaxID=261477 RepID=A0ABU1X8U9_9NOCA|nr:hypothetical protein [Nocardia kruczakiae]
MPCARSLTTARFIVADNDEYRLVEQSSTTKRGAAVLRPATTADAEHTDMVRLVM